MAFILAETLSLFFEESFFIGTSKTTQIETPNFESYVMLAYNSHILRNNLIISESQHNCFFFPLSTKLKTICLSCLVS